MATSEFKLHKFDLKQETISVSDDIVAADEAICIFVNDEYYRTLIATPMMIKELVVGQLFSEGIIKTLKEVKEVEVEPLKVRVGLTNDVELDLFNMGKVDLITTACGSISTPLKSDQLESMKNTSEMKVEAEKILGIVRELNNRSEVYKRTGGTHSAMLCTHKGRVLAFAEDVGRHNAVDKVIGAGILSGVDFGTCVLVSSGRQSSEMVLKAARSGIPVIASVAGPLRSGIRIADATGITLICFVRGQRMNVYSHSERIISSQDA